MNPGYLKFFITLGELVPPPEIPHLGRDHPTLTARTKPSVPTCITRFLYPSLGSHAATYSKLSAPCVDLSCLENASLDWELPFDFHVTCKLFKPTNTA